jgi:hypothetical protein
MKRIIYLIRDSLSGRYYTTANTSLFYEDKAMDSEFRSPDPSFKEAVIHTTLDSVKNGVKHRKRGWKADLEKSSKMERGHAYWDLILELSNQRKDLPGWGMEIVEIEVNDNRATVVPLK